MTRIAKKPRFQEVGQSLYVPAPQPPMEAQVGAFCYDENLLLEIETLGRVYYADPEIQAPHALMMKWIED